MIKRFGGLTRFSQYTHMHYLQELLYVYFSCYFVYTPWRFCCECTYVHVCTYVAFVILPATGKQLHPLTVHKSLYSSRTTVIATEIIECSQGLSLVLFICSCMYKQTYVRMYITTCIHIYVNSMDINMGRPQYVLHIMYVCMYVHTYMKYIFSSI